MGELESIKALPGMIDAAADTLHKAWRAGIDLAARAADHPRLAAIARLEAAVLDQLPPGMMRPLDIVTAATARIGHAPGVLGPLEIVGLTELSPCWRPLLQALTAHIPVRWTAGPRSVPAWLDGTGVTVAGAPAHAPVISAASAATAYHEAIEAMRWARSLLASGVPASEIAIATASPADYDDHFLATRRRQHRPSLRHGIRTVATREGQAAAALADIVVRGLSQSRCAASRHSAGTAGFRDLRRLAGVLPTEAPLSTPGAWNRLLARLTPEDWPDGADHIATLRTAVETLVKGSEAASEIGEAFLKGRALAIWRKALLAGPAASIDATLETLKQDDGLEACVCVAWMPASALAASPRRFVRLLGLNSSRWPRGIAEDRLIPDHIIPTPVRPAAGQPSPTARLRDDPRPRPTPSFCRAPATATGVSWVAALCSPGVATKPICAATGRRRTPSAKQTASWPGPKSSPPIRKRSARTAAGAPGGRPRSLPMTGSCGRIIRSFSPSSAAPSRPARCAACCAIR